MSASRKAQRAANKAAEIAERKALKEVPTSKNPTRTTSTKEPSSRPYRAPETTPKKKRVVTTVSDRDGKNLLRKIEAKGGRDIIVMMRDSELPPKELAEQLMLNEAIVITALDSYGSGKDRMQRLLSAIEQASGFESSDERIITTGFHKQKQQETPEETVKRKKKPRAPRAVVVPILSDLVPERNDEQIVLEELKQYLGFNSNLKSQITSAPSDEKAVRILLLNIGKRFDARVKGLLKSTGDYQDLLTRAGHAIRKEMRQYDNSEVSVASPDSASQESPENTVRYQAQRDALDSYNKAVESSGEVQASTDDPDEIEKQERFSRQEEVLRSYLATNEVNP